MLRMPRSQLLLRLIGQNSTDVTGIIDSHLFQTQVVLVARKRRALPSKMASENDSLPSAQTTASEGKEQGCGDTTKEKSQKTAEQKEEEKLKAKYPSLKVGPPAMLHKRLIQKGKFFDSGDYNMARAAINNPKRPLPAQEKMLLQESIGEGIPTPKDLPPRKPSIIQSKLASGALS